MARAMVEAAAAAAAEPASAVELLEEFMAENGLSVADVLQATAALAARG